MSNQYRPLLAIIKKELLENSRSGWVNAPLTALLIVLLVGVNAKNMAASFPPEQIPAIYGLLALYIPLITMPFYASSVLNSAINGERSRGSMLPLLSTGKSPELFWLGKLLATFILSYGVMLMAVVAYMGYILFYERQEIFINAQGVFNMLVTTPIIALLVMALQALIFWLFQSSTLIAVLIPLAILFGGAEMLSQIDVVNPSFLTAFMAILLSALLVGILATLVSRIPRSKAAGLT